MARRRQHNGRMLAKWRPAAATTVTSTLENPSSESENPLLRISQNFGALESFGVLESIQVFENAVIVFYCSIDELPRAWTKISVSRQIQQKSKVMSQPWVARRQARWCGSLMLLCYDLGLLCCSQNIPKTSIWHCTCLCFIVHRHKPSIHHQIYTGMNVILFCFCVVFVCWGIKSVSLFCVPRSHAAQQPSQHRLSVPHPHLSVISTRM